MFLSRLARLVCAFLLFAAALQAAPALRLVPAPSRNFSRAAGRRVDTVVIHYLSGINVDRARWSDPRLCLDILRQYRVSAHYMIDRAGTVYTLVDEGNVAWHAGGSLMPAPDNRRGVNRFSVGIELIATHTSGFTDAQYDALATLVRGIKARHPIRDIVGHDQISGSRAVALGLRRDIKPDPGPRFDWGRFRGMVE
jgi:N-acetylmuramoyl-L-alanine amidase